MAYELYPYGTSGATCVLGLCRCFNSPLYPHTRLGKLGEANAMGLLINSPGLLTTVQDIGRLGYRQYGVVTSGAMDAFALRSANLLVGNDEWAAGLEITLYGPELKWLRDSWLAVCGGDFEAEIDGVSIPLWRPIFVKKESELTFHYAKTGCRAYIAIRGGINVPEVLGSKSTYVHAGIGGLHGRALQAGDKLSVGNVDSLPEKLDWFTQYADKLDVHDDGSRHQASGWAVGYANKLGVLADDSRHQVSERPAQYEGKLGVEADGSRPGSRASATSPEDGGQAKFVYRTVPWGISRKLFPLYSSQPVVRVIRSSEFPQFTSASQHTIFAQSFTIKPQSDRMGIQLSGPSLHLQTLDAERISNAVSMGTIQVPPSGEPIILMADGQTVGGYPTIGHVASVDLPILAQLKPAEHVRFVEITHREAEALYLQKEQQLNMLSAALKLLHH